MKISNKYYTVLRGRKPGVYSEWIGPNGAEEQIAKFRGSRCIAFPTIEEAQVHLKDNETHISDQETLTPKQRRQLQFDKKLEGYRKDDTAIVYCSSREKRGRYGWGVEIDHPKRNGSYSSGFRISTSHRMELYAVLRGLEKADGFNRAIIVIENAFIVRALQQNWPLKWRDNNWKKWQGSPPEHLDLWKKILPLYEKTSPMIVLIPAKVNVPGNNRAKLLAAEACKSKNLRNDRGYEPPKNKYQNKSKWKSSNHPLTSAPKYTYSFSV
jgi:ribonuclease HI